MAFFFEVNVGNIDLEPFDDPDVLNGVRFFFGGFKAQNKEKQLQGILDIAM